MGILFKVVTTSAIAAGVYYGVHAWARLEIASEAVAMLGAFLELVGAIYSVLAAFVIYVVWEQFNALDKLTVREGSLVAEVPRLASLLGPDGVEHRRRIATATKTYLEAAAAEWEDMAALRERPAAVKALDAIEARVGEANASSTAPVAIVTRLTDAVAAVRECRGARMAAAKHRMPATLGQLLRLLSLLLLAAFLPMPVGHPWLGIVAFAALAGVLAMIRAIVWDMDHPFVGVWRVRTAPFEESGNVAS
jgi:hypothetical protein